MRLHPLDTYHYHKTKKYFVVLEIETENATILKTEKHTVENREIILILFKTKISLLYINKIIFKTCIFQNKKISVDIVL
jgi:hypothetical protein